MKKNSKNIIALIGIVVFIMNCTFEKIVQPPAHLQVQPFKELEVDFEHQWDETTHPFFGGAIIDIEQDGKMEVFIGGGNNQNDILLSYQNNNLVDIIKGTGLSSTTATYGTIAIDINNDDKTDLIISRDDGVYVYTNKGGTFDKYKIQAFQLTDEEAPFGVSVSDIDKDGDGDLYVSVFVKLSAFRSATFNEDSHAKKNYLLMNNGDGTFTDITQLTKTQSLNNTFLSTFVDLNNDERQDLVIAQNTGEVEIFQNEGNLKFTSVKTNTGYGFWMGLGVGDIDKDGDQDLFFSNSGNSIPEFLTAGDIEEHQKFNGSWILLENKGNFEFVEKTIEYGLSSKGFGWSGVFEDINLDGNLDLIVAQNYVKWPIHQYIGKLPGKAMIYDDDGKVARYYHVDELGLNNKYFGESALIVDLNQDIKPDIILLNMNGPHRFFLQQSTNNFITVAIPDNVKALGTVVKIKINGKISYSREVISNSGFMTDHTPHLTFGIGKETKIDELHIKPLDQETIIIKNPQINSLISYHF